MNFSENLKKFRIEKGIKQLDLSNQLNVNQSAVSSWEVGRTHPEYETLIKIANILEISLDELLGRETPNKSLDKELDSKHKLVINKVKKLNITNLANLDMFADYLLSTQEPITKKKKQ